jgi:hypothetical protein
VYRTFLPALIGAFALGSAALADGVPPCPPLWPLASCFVSPPLIQTVLCPNPPPAGVPCLSPPPVPCPSPPSEKITPFWNDFIKIILSILAFFAVVILFTLIISKWRVRGPPPPPPPPPQRATDIYLAGVGCWILSFGVVMFLAFICCAILMWFVDKDPTWPLWLGAAWVVLVPVYFFFEHLFFFRWWGYPDRVEEFKRVQDLAAKVWAAAIIVLAAFYHQFPHAGGGGGGEQ